MPDLPPPTYEDGRQVVVSLAQYTFLHTRNWGIIQSGLVVGALLSIALLAPEVNDPSWYAQSTIDRLMEKCAQHDALCGGC